MIDACDACGFLFQWHFSFDAAVAVKKGSASQDDAPWSHEGAVAAAKRVMMRTGYMFLHVNNLQLTDQRGNQRVHYYGASSSSSPLNLPDGGADREYVCCCDFCFCSINLTHTILLSFDHWIEETESCIFCY